MQSVTYLLINFFTIIICFIYSFDKRIAFNNYFGVFIKSCTIVAIPFIIWDIYFTKVGVWWFNETYTLGINIFGLPIEEILFFFCIPFSCVFTYYCLTKFFSFSWVLPYDRIIVFVTTIVCGSIALIHGDKLYTLITAIVTLSTVIFLLFIARVDWIGKASVVYCILMLGFFPVNGILTGTGLEHPIVNYNTSEFLGIRMGTIPIEDAVYGYTLFLLNIYFFNLFNNSEIKKA